MILLTIFFGVASIILAFGCYNLLRQNEDLEETTVFYQTKIEEIREKVLETEIQLKELDIRGAFEADDEVGFVFKEIKELSSELTKTVESVYEFTE